MPTNTVTIKLAAILVAALMVSLGCGPALAEDWAGLNAQIDDADRAGDSARLESLLREALNDPIQQKNAEAAFNKANYLAAKHFSKREWKESLVPARIAYEISKCRMSKFRLESVDRLSQIYHALGQNAEAEALEREGVRLIDRKANSPFSSNYDCYSTWWTQRPEPLEYEHRSARKLYIDRPFFADLREGELPNLVRSP